MRNGVVPEAQDLEPSGCEVCRALPVPRLSAAMRVAIQFNHQSPTRTGEICDITPNRMLTTKLASQELAVSKQIPQQLFSLSLVLAQIARRLPDSGVTHDHPLTPPSPPRGEGELERIAPL